MIKIHKLGRRVLCVLLAATMLSTVSTSTVSSLDLMISTSLLASASSSVSITEEAGAEETVYAEWSAVTDATGYNVYVKASGGSYEEVDTMLVREYSDYFRVDVPGLAAGSYVLKIVPVIDGVEDTSKQAETSTLTVESYDRTGFSFYDEDTGTYDYAVGAYNSDGTLKDDAVVLYLTEDTKDSMSLEVTTSSSGSTTTATGIQNILNLYKKGYDDRPLCIRVIGEITDPETLEDGDLLFSGSGDSKRLTAGITLEGIGEDATLNGFGVRIKNISGMEVRNIGIMLVDSDEGDSLGLQQSDDHIWVHNCDFFYGEAGSDADQAKGDGSLDCKKSTYVTFSYNHFWDTGKTNLLGLSEDTTEGLYITYHHNWYDHSDSRHPRVRYYSAHVYNNYYDGNAKYGIGATEGSSVFSESNYYRNCKYPMLISMQGTDIADGEGTFSEEDGGIIKAYGNYMEGQTAYVTYAEDSIDFDAYEVSSADEMVPSSVTTAQGDHTYNNFDTSDMMYDYTADDAEDVPEIVTSEAGRLNGGDFDWEFDDDVDDTDSDVNEELMSALQSYTSGVVAIGSGFSTSSEEDDTTSSDTSASDTSSSDTSNTSSTDTDTYTEGDIFCSPDGDGSGTSIDDPASVLDAIEEIEAGYTIYLLEGTYTFSETIVIDEDNCGTDGAYKTIKAYNDAEVVFDFSDQGAADDSLRGIVLDGDYWHFYGFEITKAADNGMLLSGNYNLIECMVFNDNQDTGLQISRYSSSAETIDDWPSYNTILNCTSKNNCDDETMENADGFAAKLTCGEGNVFDGCMSYNNSDDGWDLYAKEETGAIGVVTIQNCVAFRNGYTEYGEGYGDCDGNGFKLGGGGVGTAHVIINCLAFENLNAGFTDNNNPKLASLTNCTSYNNGVGANGKSNYMTYRCTDDGCDFSNLISYYSADNLTSNLGATGLTSIANDKFVGTMQTSIYYNSGSDTGYYYVTDLIDIENGDKSGEEVELTDDDFVSVTAPEMGTDFDTEWRNEDGSINTQGFMEMAESSTYYTVLGAHFAEVDTSDDTATDGSTDTEDTDTEDMDTDTDDADSSTEVDASEYVHNFTENGLSSNFYTISGNLSTSKGTVTYNGLTLTQCLKMETATSITFTAPSDGTLTLVFLETDANIKVNGSTYSCEDGTGVITLTVSAGTNTITKADTANLYYIVYAPNETSDTEDTSTTTTTAEESGTTTTTTTTITTTTTTGVTVPVSEDVAASLYGDVTLDGYVNLADSIYLAQSIAGMVTLSDEASANADVDQSGIVDQLDASILLQYQVNLLDTLPYTK